MSGKDHPHKAAAATGHRAGDTAAGGQHQRADAHAAHAIDRVRGGRAGRRGLLALRRPGGDEQRARTHYLRRAASGCAALALVAASVADSVAADSGGGPCRDAITDYLNTQAGADITAAICAIVAAGAGVAIAIAVEAWRSRTPTRRRPADEDKPTE